jgi:hypothetical protein
MCIRCGACCGAFEDPCSRLVREQDGTYRCDAYEIRLGLQRSVSGKKFRCVPIRKVLHKSWSHDHLCAYKKFMHSPWPLLDRSSEGSGDR